MLFQQSLNRSTHSVCKFPRQEEYLPQAMCFHSWLQQFEVLIVLLGQVCCCLKQPVRLVYSVCWSPGCKVETQLGQYWLCDCLYDVQHGQLIYREVCRLQNTLRTPRHAACQVLCMLVVFSNICGSDKVFCQFQTTCCAKRIAKACSKFTFGKRT